MKYLIKLTESAEKNLKKIPKSDRERIVQKIDSLVEHPRGSDSKKLKGKRGDLLYRIRSGDYRVVYKINDKILLVLIVEIGHRKEIYR